MAGEITITAPWATGLRELRNRATWSINKPDRATTRSSMASDDAELLARVRSGSPDEFGEVVRRYQSRVFSVLYRYERDHQKLEDLAQETFIKVWKGLDQFDGRAPFEHWLSRIATHVALDHLRRERRHRQEIGLSDLGEDALEWLRAEDGGELDSRQAAELLALAMRELSPAEQLVITMQELEGRSIKEISARTGSSSVAVRVRALRARAKLRRALERLEKESSRGPAPTRETGI